MNKQNRLILIDGSAYIFRAYYGLPPMNRADGTPINAVFGFTNMLVKLIEDYRDDKMIVIFDAARENFRNTIFKEYKANRGETPEDLIPQFEIIRQCVDAFNIPQLEIEGYEADDIIATYCKLAEKQKIDSIIVSSDKDLMQLVTKKTTMLDPMKNKKIGIDQVIEKFGLPPEKVIQIQALTGDKVDNIPGAPGIGPKTALQLIEEFGDVHKLIKNANQIPQEKRRNIIVDHEEDILVSLKLVTLKDDIKLPIDIKKIHTYSSINKNDNLSKFLSKQGFKSIAERLKNNSFIKSNIPEIIETKKIDDQYFLINNIEDLNKLITLIKKTGYLAIDTETNSLNIEEANLVGISIAVKQGEIVGLLGPNGAGKTTSFYMIVGLIKPQGGTILLDKQDITTFPMYMRAQNGIGYLAQEASVFRKLTVEQNILSVLQLSSYSKKVQKEKVESLIVEFGLTHIRKSRGDLLSGGERRRTEIARALATDPKFVLLDEPFAGVDPVAVEDIQRIIAHLKKKNIGILITDHNVQETLAITDKTYLMFEGSILKAGTPNELAKDEMVRKVYLGQNFELRKNKVIF